MDAIMFAKRLINGLQTILANDGGKNELSCQRLW
jgi:hypothetical protein